MANKDLYLSNTSTKFGPGELSGFAPGGRTLILGRGLDLTSLGDLKNYFSIIIAEDPSYATGLEFPPDITIWQPGSPYISDVYAFPYSRETLFVVNRHTLKRLLYAGVLTDTYNLAYIPGGDISHVPAVVDYAPIGLDSLATGQHLATIMGATSFYDTEGRSGTIPTTLQSLTEAVNTKDKYGVSTFYLERRYSLIDRI
jgi:hypothetical protein